MALFKFEVYTPYRLFFSDEVQCVILALTDGDIGILANHIPVTAPVRTGIMRVQDKTGVWKEAFTGEGLLEVTKKKTLLMVEAAEWPQEIDGERATASKRAAEETLKTDIEKFEAADARAKLKRAETRLEVLARRQNKH
jgi:F-type H+-transporting ATPase subunit epsilon